MKDDVRGAYQKFLKSPAGQDLIDQCRKLESAHIVNALNASDPEKAQHVNQLKGMTGLRDYIFRLGSHGAGKSTHPDSLNVKLDSDKE